LNIFYGSFFKDFVYLREKACAHEEGGGAEGEGGGRSGPPAEQGPQCGHRA